MENKIVVGVDGSPGAESAVRWAAETAHRRHFGLHLVHGLRLAELYYGGGLAGPATFLDPLREAGRQLLDDAEATARSVAGDLTISTAMPVDPPVPLLIELSREARMVVLGHSGRTAFSGMRVGSTTAAVASHGHCPVVVVRPRDEGGEVPVSGPVVVGIDGSPNSEQALATAFEEAASREAPLVALHAWSDVTYEDFYGTARLPTPWETIEAEEQRLLAQRLAGWQEKYPQVEVRRELVRDQPRHALLDLSAEARLLVVGSRGRGGFTGLLLGSTSQALIQHARCPVLVVRPEKGK
ncbi:universal stress protein [Amycolatopsis magusensis]|uniref:Nucleotide-binding universal stress UspA family protein n=1 Tax=Amycolatopsis magusensis TaxID=882444 RepID=A0ABS4PW93_9PSEU|nr:universal stress protein [Amycolatopsis magusensis]MBP2183693.1 nucleotide-binding universal stress UspA family protein [Amycolatopsis magusensis]